MKPGGIRSRSTTAGSFKLDPPEGFWAADFDDADWAKIKVPAHWEMEGFHSDTGVGGYRLHFTAPSEPGRVKLDFEGVYSGAEVWVNGQLVATHEGGATPFEADITDAVHNRGTTCWPCGSASIPP